MYELLKKWFIEKLQLYLINKCDRIIVCYEQMRETYLDAYSIGKTAVYQHRFNLIMSQNTFE